MRGEPTCKLHMATLRLHILHAGGSRILHAYRFNAIYTVQKLVLFFCSPLTLLWSQQCRLRYQFGLVTRVLWRNFPLNNVQKVIPIFTCNSLTLQHIQGLLILSIITETEHYKRTHTYTWSYRTKNVRHVSLTFKSSWHPSLPLVTLYHYYYSMLLISTADTAIMPF